MKNDNEKQNSKTTTKRTFNFSSIIALALAAIILVIAIPINMIISYFDFKFDMTPSRLYSLTDTSITLLDNIQDKEIEITILAELEDIKEITEYLPLYYALMQYQDYENITLYDYYPDEYPERVKALNPDGFYSLSQGDIIIKCGDTIKKIAASSMFTDFYDENGNITEKKYVGENLITGALKTVTDGVLPKVYFLTGHGETEIGSNHSQFQTMLTNYNYEIEQLNLSQTNAIPDDTAIIYITAPQEDISLEERDLLIDYTHAGGNIVFFMSPNDSEEKYTNIEYIMEMFDIYMDYNRVIEKNSKLHIEDDPYTVQVTLPEASDSASADLTSELNEIIADGVLAYMPKSRSFYTKSGPNSGVLEIASLMETSLSTNDYGSSVYTAESEPCGGGATEYDTVGGQLSLAYYSADQQYNSKIAVFGCAEFLEDEYFATAYSLIPFYLNLSLITWMYDSDIDMEIEDKDRAFDYMFFNSGEEATNTMRIFIIAPILVALIGLGVWLKRRNS